MCKGSCAPTTVLGVCMNVAVVELLVGGEALIALYSSKLYFFTIYTVLTDSGEESAAGGSSAVAGVSGGGLGDDLTVLIMSAIFLGILFETNSEIELRFVSWPF